MAEKSESGGGVIVQFQGRRVSQAARHASPQRQGNTVFHTVFPASEERRGVPHEESGGRGALVAFR